MGPLQRKTYIAENTVPLIIDSAELEQNPPGALLLESCQNSLLITIVSEKFGKLYKPAMNADV